MKTIFTVFILCLSALTALSQERYFVNAPSGLNVRQEASASATKTGKLPYGALVYIVETTNVSYEVNEDGKTFLSQWVKVKYDNFPYVNASEPSYEWGSTGYVVKFYLDKLNKTNIVQQTIDSTTFYGLYKKRKADEPEKITSFEKVKKMLSNRVKWSTSPLFEAFEVIDKIYLPSGQMLDVEEKEIDVQFRAYYPSEEILVFEGGHSSEYSINLKTGETLETTGNLEYIVTSPHNGYRLNGWFGGQECSSYFIQKRTGNQYTYLTEFEEDVCYFNKFHWINEGDFIYSYYDNSIQGGDKEKYVLASVNKETAENVIPDTFQSEFRPKETIQLGKMYKDTVNFVEFKELDYDERLFIVTKNKYKMVLIFNQDITDQLVAGDQLEIIWKIDGLIPAGDPEYLNFREHLVSYKKISSFELKDKEVKVLWRESRFDEALQTRVHAITLNNEYISTLSDAEKAVLGYVATFVGNECEWDGNVNEKRSNLKCRILTALDLGYQCSEQHLGFLRQWFATDNDVLQKLKKCRTTPSGATMQSSFDGISIKTSAQHQTITIGYQVSVSDMRENSVSKYTKIETFQYNAGNLTLIDSERTDTTSDENTIADTKKTFVISCGSGCAMTYAEHEIVSNVDVNQVTFKVALHMNDVQDDEYFETYVFDCTAENRGAQVQLVSDNPDSSGEIHPELQKQLEVYKVRFCKY